MPGQVHRHDIEVAGESGQQAREIGSSGPETVEQQQRGPARTGAIVSKKCCGHCSKCPRNLRFSGATDKLTRALTTSRLIGAAIGILMSALADEVTPTGALPAAGQHEPPGCYTHARRDSGSVAGDPTAAC